MYRLLGSHHIFLPVMILFALCVSCPVLAQGPAVFIDFEGLASMDYHSGSLIPVNARLSDQMASTYGVTFSSGAPYVPVVDLGEGHAVSGVNGIGGSTPDNLLTYDEAYPILFTFVDPTDPTKPGITDFVSIRGDLGGNGSPVNVKLEAFDVYGNLIGSDVVQDTGGELLIVRAPGIHTARFTGVPTPQYGGAALDDLRFDLPVGIQVASLSLAPTSVPGGLSSIGTVTLNSVAPAGGLVVSLASNKSCATVAANVTVPGGSASANFTITTTPVLANTSAVISASVSGSTAVATLLVLPASLSGLSLSPNRLVGGVGTTGTVKLTGPAPAGGIVVALKTNKSVCHLPASVLVPAGASSTTFAVTTDPVAIVTTVGVTATYKSGSRQASMQLLPLLKSVNCKPNVIIGGKTAVGTITLNDVAPAGGVDVSVSSSDGALIVPASVHVAAGTNGAAFNATSVSVSAAALVTVTASLAGASAVTNVTVKPPNVLTLKLSPSPVSGGNTVTGTVTLSGPAPAGYSIALSSSDTTAVPVPSTVTVPVGTTVATFTVTAGSVAVSRTVTVSATDPYGVTKNASVVVKP